MTHICVKELGQHWRIGDKPLSEPMAKYCQSDLREHISMKHYLKFKSFHSRNAFENVICTMAVILSRPQCVKLGMISRHTTSIKVQSLPTYNGTKQLECSDNRVWYHLSTMSLPLSYTWRRIALRLISTFLTCLCVEVDHQRRILLTQCIYIKACVRY